MGDDSSNLGQKDEQQSSHDNLTSVMTIVSNEWVLPSQHYQLDKNF